jgi:hypothetical protein
MVPVTIIYYSKILVSHEYLDSEVVVELKVWEVPKTEKYPDGVKYSLYCVEMETKIVLVGIDNHHPKGHHIHFGEEEQVYFFVDVEKLIEDFHALVKARGYSL